MIRIKRKSTIVLLLLIFAIAFAGVITSAYYNTDFKSISNVAAAVSNIGEMWDSTYNIFDYTQVKQLVQSLFGNDNQITYVKGAKDSYTNTYVRSAVDIKNKAGGEFKITLGGVDWVPASMTLTTVNGKEEVVLTLFSTASFGSSAFSSVPGNAANAYSCSDLRTNLMKSSKASPFLSGTALSDFLVQPKDIQYQHTQTNQRGIGWTVCPNDALDQITSGWGSLGSIYNVPSTTLFGGKAYNDWGNDYIWIPSYVETGDDGNPNDHYYGQGASSKSIWKLSSTQYEKYGNGEKSWRRTGHNHNIGYAYCSYSGTVNTAPAVSTSLDIRPAIHLNLTKVQDSVSIYNDPQDITDPVYNGSAQSPIGLTAKPGWWSADFADTSKFEFEYFDSNNTPVSEMKNAGDYWIKLSVKSTYTVGIFDGTPDASDPLHVETKKERWFKFKINQKPIEVQLTADTDGTYTVSAKNASDINMSDLDKRPVFGVNYTSSDGKGYTFNHPNKPDKVGTYLATAIITNSTTCNFKIDTDTSYTATYIKGKSKLTKPSVIAPVTPDIYKNADYEYGLSNYDAAKMTIKVPTGVTYDSAANKIKIRNAGTYEILFQLNSPAETCWDDATGSIADVKQSITVAKKQISVPGFNTTLINSDEVKNAPNAKVPASEIVDVLPGDTYPDILIMFSFQDGTGSEFNVYPTGAGKYKARLEIDNADSSNYELDSATSAMVVNFDVTGTVTFTQADIVWIATPNNGGNPITLTSPFELPYIKGGYTISISATTADKMSLKSKGVKIYTDGAGDNGYSGDIQQTDFGTYTAKVRLVNYDNTFDSYDETFSLKWKIVPHKVTKPEYTGGDIVFSKNPTDIATLFGLPSDWADYVEFEIEKNGDPFTGNTISDVGTYNIKISIKPSMAGNAIWDDESPFAVQQVVKIIPRNIEITGWTNTSGVPVPQTVDPGDLDYIEYIYSKMDGTSVTYNEVLASPNTTFNIKAQSKFGDNVIISAVGAAQDNETFSTPGNPASPSTPVAKPSLVENSKEYTGSAIIFELTGFDSENMVVDGSLSVTEIGVYSVTIRFRDGVNYCWDDNTRDPFILEFSVTEPIQKPAPSNPEPSIGDKIKKFFDDLLANHFPLWQVATSGVALLLTLIFMIKAIQYGNRKKKAKGEAKKYKTYAALLPIFSTQTVWLNLSNMVWSIIAFSLCGVMLLMFIIALMTRRGWKKAELAKETAIEDRELRKEAKQLELQEKASQGGDSSALIAEMRRELQDTLLQVSQSGKISDNSALEQRLIEMEERRREDEERHRQEMEAMKMMFANMMGRAQGDNGMPAYASMEDTDMLVQKVIAGLLPMVQQMVPEPTAYLAAPSEPSEDIRALTSQISSLQEQLASISADRVEGIVLPDQSEEIRNMAAAHDAEMQAMSAKMDLMQQKMDMMSAMSVDDFDDDDIDDDEEEWDSILDEDDDDFVEAVIIEEDGTVKKTYPNFRMRLKQSSDKNREWYAAVKNLFCSQKGVTYRVYKRVEKIRYQGQVIAVIGIAKRSIKLWLALKPYEYDARRYHHKDVSDKPRFVDVPMYVRVSSDRALTRAQELILALFQELNMEARKRYNDRSIQELIFTLKHNKLLTNKQNKGLLCEVMHVHDCEVLSDELAEKCIESKNVEGIDESYIETIKLDDIDAKFQDGNRVTLEKLKKVGLVSEECTGYTVTAGQRLTKPLIIVANDFTLPAVKMITLTGGRAIKLNKV